MPALFALIAVLLIIIVAGPASRAPVAAHLTSADAQPAEVLPSFAPVLPSAPAPSPTFTPLPPPIWPPNDARGGARTTPPLAQTSPRPESTLSPALWLSPSDSITVRGEIHDGRMFVPVLVDGQRLLFMLDTAGASAIDTAQSPNGNADGLQIPALQIGDVHVNGVTAQLARVTPFSQTYLGVAADGILGQDLFARFPVAIDYDAETVTIFRTSKAAHGALPSDAVVLPLQMVRGYPTVVATINGIPGTFIVDSGLGGFVTLGASFVRSRRLVRPGEGLAELRLAQPGGEIPGRTVRARSFALGSLAFDRPVVGLTSNPPSEDGPPDTSGIIGADLIRHTFIVFDEPGGVAAFAVRGASPIGQEYDRSGLWLVDRDRLVVVRSVTHGSPGDSAGLHSGDVIASIDGSAADAGNLDAIRAKLSQASAHWVSIEFHRGGVRHRTVLVLRPLL